MTYVEMMRRRNEILKRNIGSMILKSNKQGLSGQENSFYKNMIKELHQGESEINAFRNQS
ncbi:hypothetical protein PAECIP111893_04290 [Paenibacillus plantiphilus]|uniref:Fur-regulated basic protein B n=1 Tax=Paenibacillus plantiphilus TaxID=2905650 RepID=A0ABM9CL65_9BACL|nr:hypothetical protein [Paenibacillus plantiphilus]CAH1217507.1 hypothetical protein PAECIP111893_04290 [Paenibacillus plantiphilus]